MIPLRRTQRARPFRGLPAACVDAAVVTAGDDPRARDAAAEARDLVASLRRPIQVPLPAAAVNP